MWHQILLCFVIFYAYLNVYFQVRFLLVDLLLSYNKKRHITKKNSFKFKNLHASDVFLVSYKLFD